MNQWTGCQALLKHCHLLVLVYEEAEHQNKHHVHLGAAMFLFLACSAYQVLSTKRAVA